MDIALNELTEDAAVELREVAHLRSRTDPRNDELVTCVHRLAKLVHRLSIALVEVEKSATQANIGLSCIRNGLDQN